MGHDEVVEIASLALQYSMTGEQELVGGGIGFPFHTRYLLTDVVENKRDFLSNNGIETFLTALPTHISSVDLVEHLCNTIGVLVDVE